MDKKQLKTIICVVLGIALITMVFSLFSLFYDAVLMKDLIIMKDGNHLFVIIRNMLIGLVCLQIVTLVSYVMSAFSKSQIINAAAFLLSFVLIIICIVFICVIRKNAYTEGSSTYASVAGYFSELIQLLATSAIFCVYYAAKCVKYLKESVQYDNQATARPDENENIAIEFSEEPESVTAEDNDDKENADNE